MSEAFPSYTDALLAVRMLTAVKVGKKKRQTRALDELEERKFRVVCVFFAWTISSQRLPTHTPPMTAMIR